MRLEFVNVCKSYGKTRALKEFSITLAEGVNALLGPNGAGKTTLMSILTDNLTADTGEILLDGREIRGLGIEYRKRIGYMPQQQKLYDHITAERFLFYMAALKGLSKSQATFQIDKLFSLINLEGQERKSLGAFSGGMKQRVLIAQALLGEPDIIILDEPTAGLDPQERIRIRNIISQISFQRIVIVATHVVSDIELIAKEILFLREGELIQSGELLALKADMGCCVYELTVDEGKVDTLVDRYKVSYLAKELDGVHLRLLTTTPPEGAAARRVMPNLEEIYLMLLGDSHEPF
ncbi:MAG: ATP-binding cassette domain-containing protein [Oscillospiraceae bacterium]|nr:ATP-binding cassette domain-containing protein [Oscillospiraceae bacterium]